VTEIDNKLELSSEQCQEIFKELGFDKYSVIREAKLNLVSVEQSINRITKMCDWAYVEGLERSATFFDQKCNQCNSFYGIKKYDNNIGICRSKSNMAVVKSGCPCDNFLRSLEP